MRKLSTNKGQVMLLSILILGGVMLVASGTAGLLLRYQIRQVNDALSSAKALFAADTGIELASWCWFKTPEACPNVCEDGVPAVTFLDDPLTKFTTTCDPDPAAETLTIRSSGISGKRETLRVLEAVFVSE